MINKQAKFIVLFVEIQDVDGTICDEQAVVVEEYDEESARRWLIGRLQSIGRLCKRVRRPISVVELPDSIPIMRHIPGCND